MGVTDDGELRDIVRRKYMRPLKQQQLNELNSSNMDNVLDKFSRTINEHAAKHMLSRLEGTDPYGVSTDTHFGTTGLRITKLQLSGAFYNDGMAVGDKIISIDGSTVYLPEQIDKYLGGHGQAPFDVKIQRSGVDHTIRIYPRNRVAQNICGAVIDSVGYINISSFAVGIADVFRELMHDFTSHGTRRTIVDLRGNGGGYGSECIKIMELFSREGDTLFMNTYLAGETKVFRSSITGPYVGLKIDIIVDQHSGSASELMAMVGQDNGWARVIGRQTAGKGRHSSFEKMSDGTLAIISHGEYRSRRNRSIDYEYGSDGVIPDVQHRWEKFVYRWVVDDVQELSLSPAQLCAFRRTHPQPQRAALDSMVIVLRQQADTNSRYYVATVLWGRLGMCFEAMDAVEQAISNTSQPRTTSRRKR
jgi:carboxyl-terminal processing protease